jgi:hypothetical protein
VAALLTLPSCGGAAEEAPTSTSPPLTIVPTETELQQGRYQTDAFSFAMPEGWETVPSRTESSPGSEFLLSAASVSRPGTGQNSLVTIVAYDVTPVADRYPWRARDFAETYTAAVHGTVTQVPVPMRVGGLPGDSYRLRFEIGSAEVRVRVARTHRGNDVYVVQCQADHGDEAIIEKGCDAIIESLRTT